MTLLSKEKLDSIKLKQEEVTTLNTFIAVSVRRNFTFTLLTRKAGVSPAMNIQEIYNQNTPTLQIYGEILSAEVTKYGAVSFDALAEGDKAYMTPGANFVKGSDMIDILKLIIREKVYILETAKRGDHLKAVRAQLADMKTPEEKKAELLTEIAALEAQL